MDCPADKIVFDHERGEYICTETGEVIEERVVDQGPEWRAYSPKERIEKTRVEIASPLVLDGGIGSRSMSKRITKKTLVVRISRMPRKTYLIYKKLIRLAEKHKIPKHVIADAVSQLREKKFSRMRFPADDIAYALLYITAKKYGIFIKDAPKLRILNEITKVIDARYDPNKLVPSVINVIKSGYNLNDEQYVSLLQFIHEHQRETNNIVAYVLALTFVWLKMNDIENSENKFGKVVGRSEVTIRSILKKYISLDIICTNCNYVLYIYPNHKRRYFGIPMSSEIVHFYDGVCPNCGIKLTRETIKYVLK